MMVCRKYKCLLLVSGYQLPFVPDQRSLVQAVKGQRSLMTGMWSSSVSQSAVHGETTQIQKWSIDLNTQVVRRISS